MSREGKMIDATTIQFERLFPGPIERVWAYLADPDKRAEWFCGGTRFTHAGLAELVFNHSALTTEEDKPPKEYKNFTGEIRFTVNLIEVEPPRLLVWEWQGEKGEPQVTRFELTTRGDKVLLTLTESKFATRKSLIGNAAGWHTHFALLEARLAGKRPPAFWATHIINKAIYEAKLAEG